MIFFPNNRILLIWSLVWVLILSACVRSNSGENSTPTEIYELTPYKSSIPQVGTPEPVDIVTQNASPKPTITPITYTVVEGDTMLGIALNFGVTLEDLLASNPNVNPRFLSVDTVLIIPTGENQSETNIMPTPIPLEFDDPLCYRVSNSGVWCFALVRNDYQQPLEAISGKIELILSNGVESKVGMANTPINMLPAGKAMPLVTFFSKSINENYLPYLNQVNALLVTSDDRLTNLVRPFVGEIRISEDGTSATISGDALISDVGTDIQMITVLLVAYSAEEQVVGFRRGDITGDFQPGDRVPFNVTVYSLGPPIQHVDALAEAIH
jgi:LysM repeat protein